MLNPPLSLVSDDLLTYIVAHVANLPSANEVLYNLSITDRAFTWPCQSHIFKTLHLGYGSGSQRNISKKLAIIKNILKDDPSIANRVHMVHLTISQELNAWIFNDPTLIDIFQLLGKSLRPPHKLRLSGKPLIFEDPITVLGRLTQTFFSQTLTILHLTGCKNVPLTLFLICPKLREVLLDDVGVTDPKSYDEYPDELCSGREFPALERLNYRNSESLIKQMITPPPKFNTAAVLWSNLRVLTLCPYEKEEMACLQPILNIACNTLEELYLNRVRVSRGDPEQLSLAGLVNLGDLLFLRVFALYAIIKCDVQESTVLQDISLVLSTIPTSNKVTNLTLNLTIAGQYPFGGCLEEDWAGICGEVARISGEKPLEFRLGTSVFKLQHLSPGQDELYESIRKKMGSLSYSPNIRTHFWHPTRSQIFIRSLDNRVPYQVTL